MNPENQVTGAIQETIETKAPKKRRTKIWVCAALALTLLLTVVGGSIALYKPPIAPIPSSEPAQTTYHEVYLALKSVSDRQKAAAREGVLDGLFDGFGRAAGETEQLTNEAASTPMAPMEGASADTAATKAVYSGSDYGQTNVQVEGVDEADIVKNDGKYLYILSNSIDMNANGTTTQLITIVELATMQKTAQIKNTALTYVSDMYVKGDRLVVIGSGEAILKAKAEETSSGEVSIEAQSSDKMVTDIYYGYEEPALKTVIYDISDRSQIKQVREFSQEGSYSSSRLVGDNLYIVSSVYKYDLDDMKEDNVADYLPHTLDKAVSSDAEPIAVGCIAIAAEPDAVFTTVSGLSITSDAPASSQTVMGSGNGIVYSTQNHLYVTGYLGENTELMRYTLRDGQVSFDQKAEVPGYVKDQFALDESNGYLHVATTSNETTAGESEAAKLAAIDVAEDWTSGQRNNLYVLDDGMKVVGKVEDLAKGETIQSVRYMGSMAYVVTFRQTDPLFAIDLSDPKNPTVLGQLKIPGFSSYMHPIDQNTLLGIGFDADVESGGVTGFKLSLFDVTDPANPKETQKLIFSGGCSSDAAYNHKAVTYIPDKGILAIPFSVYDKVTVEGKKLVAGQDGCALIISVDKTNGIHFKGLLSDPKRSNFAKSGMWDQDYFDRMITRITYANGNFYTVSNKSVIASSMETLKLITQLDLFTAQETKNDDSGDSDVIPYTILD